MFLDLVEDLSASVFWRCLKLYLRPEETRLSLWCQIMQSTELNSRTIQGRFNLERAPRRQWFLERQVGRKKMFTENSR